MANNSKSSLVHRYSDAFDFNDNQDALAAAQNVNAALCFLTKGLIAKALNSDATTTEQQAVDGITDGLGQIFAYQSELIFMAAGESSLPFISKDASPWTAHKDLLKALGGGDDE